MNNERGPFGCVIVKDDKIIGKANNRVLSDNDPTAHAEVVAISDACKNQNSFHLNDCEIYTSCEPCPMCLGAIYWARPQRVFFANTKEEAALINFDDSFIYNEINVPHRQKKIPFIPFPNEAAKEIFRLWDQKGDKKLY